MITTSTMVTNPPPPIPCNVRPAMRVSNDMLRLEVIDPPRKINIAERMIYFRPKISDKFPQTAISGEGAFSRGRVGMGTVTWLNNCL